MKQKGTELVPRTPLMHKSFGHTLLASVVQNCGIMIPIVIFDFLRKIHDTRWKSSPSKDPPLPLAWRSPIASRSLGAA